MAEAVSERAVGGGGRGDLVLAGAGLTALVGAGLWGVWCVGASVEGWALAAVTLGGAASVVRAWHGGDRSGATDPRSAELLRVTLESIGDGVVTTDAQGRVATLNPVARALTGWSQTDAVGRPLAEVFRIVDEGSRETVADPVRRALAQGVVVGLSNHTVLIARDGGERSIADSAAPIRTDDGTVVGAVLVFRDVSERRTRRAAGAVRPAVRRGHGRYRPRAAVLVLTPELRVQSANRSFYDTFGVARGQTEGRRLYDLGDGQWDIPALRTLLEDLLPQNTRFHDFEVEHDFPGIGRRIMRLNARRLHRDGDRTESILLAIEDITVRETAERTVREARERLRVTLASIGDGVVSTDPAGNVTYLNPVAEALTGWTDAEAAGRPLTEVFRIVNETTRKEVANPALRALEQGVVVGLANHTILIAKDGAERPIADSAAPIRDTDGQVVGAVLVFRDVSERHAAQRRVRETRDRLDRALMEVSVPTLLYAEDGEILLVNRAWTEITGYSHRDIPTIAAWTERAYGERREFAREHIDRLCAAERRVDDGEWQVATADGRTRLWHFATMPLGRDADGRRLVVSNAVDVTEQRRDAWALTESERRRRLALDAAELGTWNVDLATGEMVTDQRFRVVFAGADVPMDYQQAVARIHPDDRDRVLEEVAAATRPEDPAPYGTEYRVVHADGAVRWVQANGRAVFAETTTERAPVSFDGTVADVTERRQAVDALAASEARFRQLADAMPQIVWTADAAGVNDYCNRRWYEYIGQTAEQVGADGWTMPLHPDDRRQTRKLWRRSVETGQPFQMEHRFRSAAGDYRWFLGRALPVRDAAGGIVKWYGTCTDVEEFRRLRDERQKLVALAENSTDFIGMCDLDLVPFYVNPAGRDMVGLDAGANGDPLDGLGVQDFFFEEDRVRITDEFLPHVLAEGAGEIEIRLRHFRTGEGIWVLYRVFALADRDGAPTGLATVSREIGDRKRLEEDLRTFAADLSEANRRKDEFLATLAHELRNPLAPICSGLELLRLAPGDEEIAAETHGMMERQAAQLVRLVDDLLNVSRITSGKLELRMEPVLLADVVGSAVEETRPFIDSLDHELTLDLPERPIHLHADAARLAQVLANLLTNAAKYTPPGGHIELSVRPADGEVAVAVRDDGSGIPADRIDDIFEMFTQIDRLLERTHGGLGIGLMLVRKIVDLHGGAVAVASPGEGLGSTFTVTLPTRADAADAAVAAAIPPTLSQSRRVLIIDDNHDAADVLAMIVGSMGMTTRTAYDGREGLEIAEQFRPDVVLMDIGMPRLNGYEAARAMRALPWGSSTTLVALTGWGQDEDRQRTRDAGFDHHLVKPADPAALRKLLEQ